MPGRSRIIQLIFLWICTFDGTQVQGFIDDALNPVRDISDVWQQRSQRLAVRINEDSCGKDNVYVCEVAIRGHGEPETTVAPDAPKTCTYRNQRYHEQVYRWVAGRGCLLYTPDSLFVGGANTINLNAGCFYGDWFAPCLEMVKEDGTCACYPFDPGLEAVAVAVRNALLPMAHTRWERCFYAAQQCCSHYMHENVTEDPSQCKTSFDGWTCWTSTEAGTTATEVCSEFAYPSQGPSCNHYSSKRCRENGTWEMHTDYSSCSPTPQLLRRYRIYIGLLSVSVIICLPAICVFVFYKRLRRTISMGVHRNLLIAIIVKNALVIVNRVEIYIDELTNEDESPLSTHMVWCRLLAVVERVAANTVFLCLLVEGIYLHRVVVAGRTLSLKWLYGIGAVLVSMTPVAAWTVMMIFYDDHSCWLVYTTRQIQWILDGPRLLVLLITTALTVHALRVLTNGRNFNNIYQLNTAKATLTLMPVFAAQFLIAALKPATNNCIWEHIYYYVAWTVEALDGLLVATMYCYVNKEVHALVNATYNKTKRQVVSRLRQKSYDFKPSFQANQILPYSIGLAMKRDDKRYEYAIRPDVSDLKFAEIISIHDSERLSSIKEPFYEIIESGIPNEGYDELDRSVADSNSVSRHNGPYEEEYYGFTNASSVSADAQDWMQYASAQSNSDLNISEFNAGSKFPFPNQSRQQEIQSKSINFGLEPNHGPRQLTRKEQNISDYEYCDNDCMLQNS